MAYLGLIIGYLIIILTPVAGLWHKAFPRLERKPTDAFIPFYQYFSVLKACGLPWYWSIFLLLPGIQFIMWACINVSYIRKFGVFGIKETILGIVFPYPVMWKIANKPEEFPIAKPTNWDVASQVNNRMPSDHVALFFALPVIGHAIVYPISMISRNRKAGKKSVIKEWGDAILFAVIAASAIRTYVFEPFKIPTGSMEKTLLVGDHLFVDKLTYGPRLPMTPFSYPIVHNSFAPLLDIKSYTTIQTIPYTRLPGFRGSDFVERNDVTVFNFPAGDTALNDSRMPDGLVGHNYHEILKSEALYICLREGNDIGFFEKNMAYYKSKARKNFEEGKVKSTLVREEDQIRGYTEINGVLPRPVDKRENYIKRCVAISGDVIEIVNKELYINNEVAFQAEQMQYRYSYNGYYATATPEGGRKKWTEEEQKFFKEKFDVNLEELGFDDNNFITIPMSKTMFEKNKSAYPDLNLYTKPKGYYTFKMERDFAEGRIPSYYPVFPNDKQYDWTEDNFGPLRIPAAGDKIELTKKTIPIYRRIITAYEGHTLKEDGDQFFIDGKKVDTYTIEQNYYWLMGDNRNSSADSRFWGFVPEDHIVGHAAFIWLSVDQYKGMFGGGMRWSRMFSGIE